ncbi:cytochrome c oxidase assembly protein [Demequina sp. SYSU T00039]|uniref:Cytochrome c oxidase assembly protein n=1 Tax=Demequina lignilytica TaxID=3051663 RepID=A0AAW7M326_9MICO|nr:MULTISPECIES: cytochrome c oxidase assembly protein [unclassified Demequina]MDN4477903.1 cytochrome c oxidase assembly protein [Demequina sp. SYSU T00039-1]MDN4487812.1 cytochrome c oxidase assembly protein [Demequina sp. SYSU T00039]
MSAELLVTVAAGLRDVSIAMTAGALLIIAGVLPRGHAAVDRAAMIARVGSIVWVLSALGHSMATYASIRGELPDASRFIEEWWSYSQSVDLLAAYLQVLAAGLVASVLCTLVRTPTVAAWSLVPVLWALGWLAQTGHAAGAADHHLATSAMFLHLAGSAIWLGVIGAMLLLRGPLGDDAKAAVRRASRLAVWAAAVLIVSGAANGWIRLSSPAELVTTTYGRLLLLKIGLMSVAVALAVLHRRVSLPRLSERQVRERFWRVMMIDVGALVAVVTVAAVLASTAPPIPIEPVEEPSPAYFLTGYELPPAPSALNWIVQWRLEIISAFVLVALAVLYLRGVAVLRRRGDAWPWYRTANWLAGIVLMLWITQGAPSIYGMVAFSSHMVEHMLLVMVAPVPLTFAAPITLALRAIEPRRDGSVGPREWIRAVVESRWMRFWANPIVAAVSFAAFLVAFYYSPLFEFALRNHAGHLWMILHFTVVGYLFVNALVGIDPGPTRPRYPLRIVLLFSTMAFHAFFGVSLMMSTVLLAPTWFGLMGRDWGPDAITDQQYGGQIAWGIGELPVLLLAIGIVTAWRRADAKETRRKDRQADRDHDAELRAYNEMLARTAEQDVAQER